MNFNLLRPFSLEAAKRGEEICYLDGDKVDFIGTTAAGDVAVHYAKYVRVYIESLLRMKPLAWVEDRPVYKGDVLYYLDYEGCSYKVEQTIEVIGMNPRDGGKGIEGTILYTSEKVTEGSTTWAPIERWTWTKPEPVKKTITVKFLGYMRGDGRLVLLDESKRVLYKRVPSEDKTCEVEE